MASAWEEEPRAREEGPEAKRPRVLLVDDDAGMRRALARTLAREGLEPIAAATGAEALAVLADRLPDLVVLDVGLPDLDGFTLCERIRALPGGGELPIIMLTGRDDVAALERAFDVGATDFASKGEHLAALAQRARFLLRARATLAALRASEDRLTEAQRLAQLASWRYELATRTLAGDAELWRLLGRARGELPRIHPDDSAGFAERVRECLRSGRTVGGELRARADDGSERSLRYRMRLQLDAQGEPIALEGIAQDVSEWRRSQARAHFLANYDELTGLGNRQLLLARLASELARAGAAEGTLAVIALGVDPARRVAETLGREAGDLVLQEAARRLGEAARPRETPLAASEPPPLHRTGAEQFALVVRAAGGPDAVAALAMRLLAALEDPIRLAAHEVMISGCAGVALSANDGRDPETLLRNAEHALSQARAGSARVRFYSRATSALAVRRLDLESKLRRALERGELALHYQPKLSLASGAIVGFEGLVRWHDAELGWVPPSEFISVAEETGSIVALGDWVLREACRQQVEWRERGLGCVPIAVNLSARQFLRGEVARRVQGILAETGAEPSAIGLEITESVLFEDAENALRELHALRALGVELALDDFGTGFSSLAYLRRLPVSAVKIDRSFLEEIGEREDAAALTASIVALAKALWLRVIAEGVEREPQRALLQMWGCDEAQGFLFHPALPAPEAEQLWHQQGAAKAAAQGPG